MKTHDILKFIDFNEVMCDLMTDETGTTIFRVGDNCIQIDRDDDDDDYRELLRIELPTEVDGEYDYGDEDANIPDDNSTYKCTGAAVINMANIFGGVYAAAFVTREGSPFDLSNTVIDDILLKTETWHNLVNLHATTVNNKTMKALVFKRGYHYMMPPAWLLQINADKDDKHSHDMYVIVTIIDVENYNIILSSNAQLEKLISNIQHLFTYIARQHDRCEQDARLHKIIDAAITGINAAIQCGACAVPAQLSSYITADKNLYELFKAVPDICQIGDYGSIAANLCNQLLEHEKLNIGRAFKHYFESAYIPEIPDCHWLLDSDRILFRTNKSYPDLLGSIVSNENLMLICKINLLNAFLEYRDGQKNNQRRSKET